MVPFIFLAVGSLVTWGACVFVLVRFDPLTGGWVAHALFYASLSLALMGTLMLFGLLWHFRRRGMSASRSEVGMIARQAFLIVAFVILTLNLAAYRLLKWWNIVPLALLTLTLELFFMSLATRGRRRTRIYDAKQTLRENIT